MRLGQTSFIQFLSNVVTSAIGFLATLYFARTLGAETLGIYYLLLAVVSWLRLAGEMGVGGAITKRVSEGEDRGAYLVTGAFLISSLTAVMVAAIAGGASVIQSYIGHPNGAVFVVVLIVTTLVYGYQAAALRGQQLVHLLAGISTLRTIARAVLQVGLVALGYEVLGLVTGWAAGTALAATIGMVIVLRALYGGGDALVRPNYEHLQGLTSYAKYSWLGGVRGRTFNWIDVAILGLFAPANLIGIYSVAWYIASFLQIFGKSIRTSMFPEMSQLSADNDHDQVRGLLADGLAFGGLIIIPGLVGGVLLGERLLQIYGSEFVIGIAVLGPLIFAVLIYDYQLQISNTLNAIDRPDLSFRLNAVFIVTNVGLNLVFIRIYGWIGAAIATVLSAFIGLIVAIYYLRRMMAVTVPIREIARQWLAAGVMGIVVQSALWMESTYRILAHNAATVIAIVTLGAGVYVFTLFVISSRFRGVVRDNSPVEIPSVGAP
ncbi:flippase [Halopenitus sp. H-Gu1]|uniref:flippase n=1 Tax=Halopenitus sp. H-Gu1 TaxID=3242697 RepID=UPI00359DF872